MQMENVFHHIKYIHQNIKEIPKDINRQLVLLEIFLIQRSLYRYIGNLCVLTKPYTTVPAIK